MALIKHPDKSNFWEKAFILANSVKGQSPVAGMRVAGTCLHVTSAVRKQITMSLGVQLPLSFLSGSGHKVREWHHHDEAGSSHLG